MSEDRLHHQDGAGRRRLFLLPIAILMSMMALFSYALSTGDPSRLPSALIGKPVPAFNLPRVEGLELAGKPMPGLSNVDLARGEVSIVNVWASWCVPCREEQPVLARLAARAKAPLLGINHKDAAADAKGFLATYGNPFQRIGADRDGRVSIDFGVYGVPETFIVDGKGRIAFRHVGPITDTDIVTVLMPAIAQAQRTTTASP